jgi:hypothetical protein
LCCWLYFLLIMRYYSLLLQLNQILTGELITMWFQHLHHLLWSTSLKFIPSASFTICSWISKTMHIAGHCECTPAIHPATHHHCSLSDLLPWCSLLDDVVPPEFPSDGWPVSVRSYHIIHQR